MFKIFSRPKKEEDKDLVISRWQQEGRPAPPPHFIKQMAVEYYREKYNLNILVETGTYLGDMVDACKKSFSSIYSVELSEKLFKKAKKRFQKESNITILQGDSGTVLAKIISGINKPALFWLDGHYSGGITALGSKECPVPEELHSILNSPINHVILIDDARLFNGTHDYPTVEEIKNILIFHNKKYNVEIENDIIRLTPTN